MDNHFIFIAPVYNAAVTLEQMIVSIVAQSYRNWQIVMVDDVSSVENRDKQRSIVRKYKDLIGDDTISLDSWDGKIVYTENNIKCWEVENVLYGIHEYSKSPDDIICRIDGDDWLTDNDILHIINHRYVERDIKALWTAHRWGFSDMNISNRMDACQDPYLHHWVSSHLKTYKRSLLDNVPIENFQGEDGKFIRRAGDQAIYLPALHNAKGNWFFEPRCAYHYTIDMAPATFQSDDAKFQKTEAEFLRNRGYVDKGAPWEKFFEIQKA